LASANVMLMMLPCGVQGVVPEHFARASGGLIRHILQQLEEIGFVEKNPGSHGGRRITSQVGILTTAVPHDSDCIRLLRAFAGVASS
jgi:Ribosomal protein S19e